MSFKQFITRKDSRLPDIISLLALLIFTAQGLYFTHHLDITMDEGTYLMKGVLFINGKYQPFQEYGPLTNKMPLAYLVPGAAQVILGPGLRTGRYFSVFLGALVVFGIWVAARRLGGRWWAAISTLILAASAANIMFYSLAISQGLTAALLTWSLALVLGKDRKLWELLVGSALGYLTIMVRQNMAPLLVFIILYIFWEHGWRKALFAMLLSGFLAVSSHIYYWPRIMELWTRYLPEGLNVALDLPVMSLGDATSNWSQQFNVFTKIYVFFEGVRFNFLAVAGSVACWILWPARKDWINDSNYKIAVILSGLIIVLFYLHYWASIGNNSCVYCFAGYLAFFYTIGMLLVVVSYRSWIRLAGKLRGSIAILMVAVSSIGIGYGAYPELDDILLNIQVPRVKNMQLQGGTTEVFRVLMNKFGWSYDFVQQLLPTIAGAGFGILLLLGTWFYFSRKNSSHSMSYGVASLQVFLLWGLIFTPSPIMSGSRFSTLCEGDVIASHEAAGKILSKQIPPGSLVYWQNDVSPLPLLYLPDIRVFPPQLNHWYTYLQGGEPDLLERAGFWNAELASQWKLEADYLLIAERYVNSIFPGGGVDGITFDELTPTQDTVPCRPRSIIHIYRRIR